MQDNSEQYLLKFLDAIFEYNYDEYKKIVTESDSCKQFRLYIKYEKDKLMGFLQKIDVQLLDQLPKDCEELCEKEGLFVE